MAARISAGSRLTAIGITFSLYASSPAPEKLSTMRQRRTREVTQNIGIAIGPIAKFRS